MNLNFLNPAQRFLILMVFLTFAFNLKASYTLTDADVEMDANGYIISCSYSFVDKDIIIPETLDGYAVKGIGDDYNNLFYDKDIVSIQFPSEIEYIGRYAFRSNKLTSVDIPTGITTLEERVFSANLLTSITIPDNIISIGQEAFSYNPLTSVTIPSGVDYIGKSAFRSNKLTSISISAGVISIGESAFFNNELTSVTIPNSVSSIGIEAFASNELTGLTSFVLPTLSVTGFVDWLDGDGNHYAGGSTVTNLSTIYRANFPYTLTDADVEMDVNGYIISCSYSFEASMITIPETLDGYAVKGIGDDYRNLFKEKAITSIQLPSGLEYIGNSAFSYNMISSVTLPNNLTSLEIESFSHNLLSTLIIPNSVSFVGNASFWANKLTNITISTGIDTIRDMVFAYNQLSSITIPENVTSIGSEAFRNNLLESVIIPNSVSYIGESAFRFNQLTGFVLPAPTLPGFIDWTDGNGNLYDAGTTVEDLGTYYRARIPYILTDDDVEMDAQGYITSCSYSFEVKDIMVPGILDGYSVKGIGDDPNSLFYRKGLTSIQLPSGLEYIGYNAFTANELRSVSIPNSVTTIAYAAFGGNKLTELIIPENVVTIGNNAFAGNQLTSIDIPINVKFIGSYAFSSNNLDSITIPNSVTSIEDWVFYGNQLTHVSIPNSVISIGIQAFGKNQLTSVDIPNSVTYIKTHAFTGNQLTSFTLPTPTLAGFTDWVDGNGDYHQGGVSVSTDISETTYYRARIPYTLTDDDVEMDANAYILSCSYNFEASIVTIPDILDGYEVKGIVNGSWYSGVFSEKSLLSVLLPTGIEYIGASAFKGNLISSIDLPISVTFLGNNAFSANQLTSLYLQDSVKHLGAYAFSSNPLESVRIPNSITYIPGGSFSGNSLTSITIPNSVVRIGEHAFAGIANGFVLPTPTLPGFVDWIDVKTDLVYQGGDTVTDTKGYYQARFGYILTDEDVEMDANGYIISYSYSGTEGNIVIPDTLDGIAVRGIADGAADSGVFFNKTITSLILPQGIEYIGAYAFNSNYLASVTIPNSVVTIGEHAFSLNQFQGFALPSPDLAGFIDWIDSNGNHYAGGEIVTDLSGFYQAHFAYILTDKDVEVDARGYIISCTYSFDSKDIMIPDSLDGYKVLGIADGLVKGFTKGPEESGVFYNKAIGSIALPSGLKYIGAYAFSTNLLENLSIPDNVTYIGIGAFSSNLLSSVAIPNSISFIGAEAFSLNQFTEFVLPTPTLTGFIDWLDSNGNHFAGGAMVTDLSTNYRASFPYTLTDADVEMDASGYIISCSYGFEASVITIPNTLDGAAVKGIGDDYNNLFYEKAISSVQLPSGLEYIGAYAFSKNLLTSVTIPSSVAFIGAEAFSNNLLTGFVLPLAQKEGYTFDDWNGSIAANTEVADLSVAYTANFTLITGLKNVPGFKLRVYPNPAKGFIIIEADDITSVELMSVSGVLFKQLNISGTQCTIDLSSYESGIYLLRIAGKHGTCVKRFVKE